MSVGLRWRVEVFKGSGEWREVSLRQSLPAEKTAVPICDMWDEHGCSGATERVNGLVANMAPYGAGRSRRERPRRPGGEITDIFREHEWLGPWLSACLGEPRP